MTRYTHNPAALGLANGTAQTSGNSGGAAGASLTPAGTAPTFQSGRWRASTASGVASRSDLTVAGTSMVAIEPKFVLNDLPSGGNCRLIELPSVFRLDVMTTGQVRLYDSTNASVWTSTHAYTAGSQPRIHVGAQSATTSTGKYRVTLFEGDSTTPLETMPAIDNANAGSTVSATSVRVLKITTAGAVGLELAYLQVDDAQITSIGPLITLDPPTLSVVTSVMQRIDLTGSAPDTGGTLTFALTHVSGPDHLDVAEVRATGRWDVPRDASATSVYRGTIMQEPGGAVASQDITVPPVGGSSEGIVEEVLTTDGWE